MAGDQSCTWGALSTGGVQSKLMGGVWNGGVQSSYLGGLVITCRVLMVSELGL